MAAITAGAAGATTEIARPSLVAGARIAILSGMASLALVQELLISLGGLVFVSLVLALFVVLAKFAARRVLDEDDGSSL